MNSGVAKPNSVNWDSLSYVILCYAKMRQKVAPFSIVDFWNLRNRQPDIPSKLKKYFTFLVARGYLATKGERYVLTPKGEHQIIECARRRRKAMEKRNTLNAQSRWDASND